MAKIKVKENDSNRIGKKVHIAKNVIGQGIAVELFHSLSINGRCTCGSSKCERPAKHPIVIDSERKIYTTIKGVKRALRQHPYANIAARCGKESGVIAIDCDPRNGGAKTLDALVLKYGKLPQTCSWRSGGGGINRLVRYPKTKHDECIVGSELGKGLDIIADGKSILIPPSSHVSGRDYAWIKGRRPGQVPIAELPREWQGALPKKLISTSNKSSKSHFPDALEVADGNIREGQRNTRLAQIAGSLHRQGFTADAVLKMLMQINVTLCVPQLSDEEVQRLVRSITKREGGADVPDHGDPADWLANRVLEIHYSQGNHLLFADGQGFMAFNGTHWEQESESIIKNHMKGILDQIHSNQKLKKDRLSDPAIHNLKAHSSKPEARNAFRGGYKPIINCANGEIHVQDDGSHKVKPHDPKNFLTGVLPTKYQPKATAPLYHKAMLEIFSCTSDPQAMFNLMNELAGIIISGWRKQPLILIYLGSGRNGKTAFVSLLISMLGEDLVRMGDVGHLRDNRFAIGELFGKLLFVDDDVAATGKLPDEILKKISEAKPLSGEKKYRNAFNFTCRAMPLLLCNHRPNLKDLSFGMRRRLLVVPFEREFTDDEADPNLFAEIFRRESSGVLNCWLNGLERVVRRGYVKVPAAARKAIQRTVERSHPVSLFVADRCQVSKTSRIPLTNFYEAFIDWADQEKIPMNERPPRNTLANNLDSLGHKILTKGGRKKFVYGLSLREQESDIVN